MKRHPFTILLSIFFLVACGKNQSGNDPADAHFEDSISTHTASQFEEKDIEIPQIGGSKPTGISNRAGNGEPIGGTSNTTEASVDPMPVISLEVQMEQAAD